MIDATSLRRCSCWPLRRPDYCRSLDGGHRCAKVANQAHGGRDKGVEALRRHIEGAGQRSDLVVAITEILQQRAGAQQLPASQLVGCVLELLDRPGDALDAGKHDEQGRKQQQGQHGRCLSRAWPTSSLWVLSSVPMISVA